MKKFIVSLIFVFFVITLDNTFVKARDESTRDLDLLFEQIGADKIEYPKGEVIGIYLTKPKEYTEDYDTLDKNKVYPIIIYTTSNNFNNELITRIKIDDVEYLHPTAKQIKANNNINRFKCNFFEKDLIVIGSNMFRVELLKEVPTQKNMILNDYSFGLIEENQTLSKRKIITNLNYKFSKDEDTLSINYLKRVKITSGKFIKDTAILRGTKYWYYFNTNVKIQKVYESILNVQYERFETCFDKGICFSTDKKFTGKKITTSREVKYVYNETFVDNYLFGLFFKQYDVIQTVNKKIKGTTYQFGIAVGGSGFNQEFFQNNNGTCHNYFYQSEWSIFDNEFNKQLYAKPLGVQMLELKYLDEKNETVTQYVDDIYRPVEEAPLFFDPGFDFDVGINVPFLPPITIPQGTALNNIIISVIKILKFAGIFIILLILVKILKSFKKDNLKKGKKQKK